MSSNGKSKPTSKPTSKRAEKAAEKLRSRIAQEEIAYYYSQNWEKLDSFLNSNNKESFGKMKNKYQHELTDEELAEVAALNMKL